MGIETIDIESKTFGRHLSDSDNLSVKQLKIKQIHKKKKKKQHQGKTQETLQWKHLDNRIMHMYFAHFEYSFTVFLFLKLCYSLLPQPNVFFTLAFLSYIS